MTWGTLAPPPRPTTRHILVFRTQVGDGYNGNEPKFDWRQLGEFVDAEHAVAAARQLNLSEARYQVLDTGVCS